MGVACIIITWYESLYLLVRSRAPSWPISTAATGVKCLRGRLVSWESVSIVSGIPTSLVVWQMTMAVPLAPNSVEWRTSGPRCPPGPCWQRLLMARPSCSLHGLLFPWSRNGGLPPCLASMRLIRCVDWVWSHQ